MRPGYEQQWKVLMEIAEKEMKSPWASGLSLRAMREAKKDWEAMFDAEQTPWIESSWTNFTPAAFKLPLEVHDADHKHMKSLERLGTLAPQGQGQAEQNRLIWSTVKPKGKNHVARRDPKSTLQHTISVARKDLEADPHTIEDTYYTPDRCWNAYTLTSQLVPWSGHCQLMWTKKPDTEKAAESEQVEAGGTAPGKVEAGGTAPGNAGGTGTMKPHVEEAGSSSGTSWTWNSYGTWQGETWSTSGTYSKWESSANRYQ